MSDLVSVPLPEFEPRTDDPAWQPPRDPLTEAKPNVIAREIPLISTQSHWSWGEVRGALDDLKIGIFDRPSQLTEMILWNPRVQAAMASRTGGLFGRPVKFEPSHHPKVKGSRAAKEAFDAWIDAWPSISNEASFAQIHTWGVMMFGLSQMLWDTSVTPYVPHLVPFHPRYTYYQFNLRRLIALTLDGQTPVTPGDGHWVLHAPYGEHRGWMRAAMPALAQAWVQRNFAARDLARFSERHGFPMLKALVPAVADAKQILPLRNALQRVGQESVLELPQGVDKSNSYDVQNLEATSTTWQVFPESISLMDADIILVLLAQNLMTEVKEGSFAAARMHGDVRQAVIEFDDRALAETTHYQVARPFCLFNFGDADLAPWTSRDIQPFEDNAAVASAFSSFANGLLALKNAGSRLKNPAELARRMGLRLKDDDIEDATPTQVEAAMVGKSGGASE